MADENTQNPDGTFNVDPAAQPAQQAAPQINPLNTGNGASLNPETVTPVQPPANTPTEPTPITLTPTPTPVAAPIATPGPSTADLDRQLEAQINQVQTSTGQDSQNGTIKPNGPNKKLVYGLGGAVALLLITFIVFKLLPGGNTDETSTDATSPTNTATDESLTNSLDGDLEPTTTAADENVSPDLQELDAIVDDLKDTFDTGTATSADADLLPPSLTGEETEPIVEENTPVDTPKITR